MKLVIKRIDFDAPRELVFAAVQLASPALQAVTATRTYEWNPGRRSSQIDEARRILDLLFAGEAGKKPDVVAFAEYSLPPDAHQAIPFQALSDEHHCIIIAGSYFDLSRGGEFFRNNLCKIYLPSELEPLVICKGSPATAEKEFLLSSDKLPNIARLIWQPPGREAVSISIFICRDYLTPFQERPNKSPETPEDNLERVSLLDWQREGINIVIMHNDDPALFEAAAAFDIRRTHGKRKLVLFVNSANHDGKLATALVGANTSEPRERDIAAKMPSAQTGVLSIETLLWDVVSRKEDPDTELGFPIKHWDGYGLSSEGDLTLEKLRKETSIPKMRGIFHPAFLAAMQKYIVIELFVARSTQKIEKAFKDGKIDFVSASHVRGIEDVVVRRYIEGHTVKPGTIPSLSQPYPLPYSRLTPEDFADAFDVAPQAPSLKILIDPTEIRKFRGVRVEEVSEKKWIELCEEITVATHGREALKEIIDIATMIPPGGSIPKKYQSVFSLGVENVPPVGRESQIRETYLLISTESADETSINLFRDFLNANLMDDARVRDIFDFATIFAYPPVRRQPFQFLLRLKCTVFEADDILSLIQSWADRTRARVGTRSYDAWRTIKLSATRGILEATMTQDEVALAKALCAIDPDFILESHEFLERFAEAIRNHTRVVRKIRSSESWNDIAGELTKFLHYICVYNCVKPLTKKRNYREEAAKHWNQLYKFLETASRLLLINALRLPMDSKRGAVVAGLKEINPEYFKKSAQAGDAGFFRWFGDLYDETCVEAKTLTKMARAASTVSGFRNLAVHGGVGGDLDASMSITGSEWRVQFDSLDGKVEAMCELIVKFADELDNRGLTVE